MGDFPITLVAKQTCSNNMGKVFTKNKQYKAKEMGGALMVRDNFKCIRHFYGDWKKDKLFIDMFTIKENTNETEVKEG